MVKESPRNTRKKVLMATQKDVANLAHVSVSTVSRVLSGEDIEMISDLTRERVRTVADQLAYSPNPFARALRGKRTNLIGLIVREIDDPFFARLISVISLQARQLGYQLVLGHAHSDPEEALEMTGIFETRHCDGLLVVGDWKGGETDIAQMQSQRQDLVVALCTGTPVSSVSSVNCDNRVGMRMLMDHLFNLGHRKFAFIDGGWLGDIRERKNFFSEYLSSRGLNALPEWIRTEKNEYDGGARATRIILESKELPTAIIASDDVMAIGALKAAQDLGVKVPDDVSIVGFDDIEMASYVTPTLTTVRQSVQEMSRRALEILLEMIESRVFSSQVISIAPEIIVRESSGRAKH